jgi:hypothetical protein
VLDQETVGLLAHEPIAGDEQAPIGKKRDAVAQTGRRAVRNDFDLSVEVDGEDLVGSAMRKPEPAVVPTGGLDVGEAVEQYAGCDSTPLDMGTRYPPSCDSNRRTATLVR